MRESVRHFAQVAVENGCDGIILPGTCLDTVGDIATSKLVPGIRPEEYKREPDAQKQIVTPHEAIVNGADILVCGSPIYKAPNPAESLQNILSQIQV
jgi:orotidine-5'-phosphate decarboxylase